MFIFIQGFQTLPFMYRFWKAIEEFATGINQEGGRYGIQKIGATKLEQWIAMMMIKGVLKARML